jgi:isoleucyl-tRNA synthetase
MESYRLYRTVPAMVHFVDKLTNWYIRRSRRRFWKSEDDGDKAAAYATLYQVLVAFSKALAPVLPFITESIYQNLVRSHDEQAPTSVHLCAMPQANEALRDEQLEAQMELATRAVVLGRSLRAKHNLKTRQPLRRLFLLPPDDDSRRDLQEMVPLLADELNIKEVVLVEDETELSEVSYRPNFRVLGPRFGKRMKEVGSFIAQLDSEQIAVLRSGGVIDVADGQISMDDIDVQRQEKEGVVVAIDNNLGVGLDVQLDEELISECTAREFVNRVQNMRKDAGLDVSDRIRIGVVGQDELQQAVIAHRSYIAAETLALEIETGTFPSDQVLQQEWQVNNYAGNIAIARA